MVARVLLSALHVLALAIGFGAVFARGRRLRDLRRVPEDAGVVGRLLQADSFWGLAALLWIITGFGRVFSKLEKTPEFYLRNGFFWVKLGLFALIILLEILPMVTFIRWRIARGRGKQPAAGKLDTLITINDAETVIVLLIPFVAALMARGAWLY